jgi:primosomal protein N' (replication factor Y) (superfamily II helicase)
MEPSSDIAPETSSPATRKELFAEVAIPAHVPQTYSYRIPPSFHAVAQRGCRVAVPLRRQLQIGYVVALHDAPASEASADAVRDVEEWLDETPIFSQEILDLTQWVADYYYAPWGETLKAALPTGLETAVQTWISLTDAGRETAARIQPALFGVRNSTAKQDVLLWLAESGGEAATEAAPPERSPARLRALMREMEREGLVAITQRTGRRRVPPKRQTAVRLVPVAEGETPKLTDAQRRALETLRHFGEPTAFTELTEAADVSPSVVHALEKKGLAEVFVREVRRDPLANLRAHGGDDDVTLNAEQAAAHAAIADAGERGDYACFLLQGVTGSGKTEVYLAAMQSVLERGFSALMLVPEIGLTPMLSRKLARRFGDLVAILHSSLSPGERLDEWERIRNGQARVVIGTRSAVFAPLGNLGLIIIDEEHDGSYKQSESLPHYHARDTAIVRASRLKCPIVLGSATPAIETAQNAAAQKYVTLELKERFGGRALAEVALIDMREVFKRHKKQRFLSDELQTALAETCARGEQAMVLLNRRGFSSFLLCRSCGFTAQCPNCDVTLTFHKAERRLTCHYCNHHAPVPETCANCGGGYIHYVGEGTEQLEEKLREAFPSLRIARLDRDTTRRRGVFDRVLSEFAAGGIDILVGTQMIAKGHDFPNVTLVGVVSVDAGLGMPDFRSAERTFQLLAQVAGRAGRGDRTGRVLIQTYHPEHYVLRYAREQDYAQFFREEITYRRLMYYPPFSVLANVIIRHAEAAQAAALADRLRRRLQESAKMATTTRILGPAPAPMAKLKTEYRYQILIKARRRQNIRDILDLAFAALDDGARRNIFVEIDPTDLM